MFEDYVKNTKELIEQLKDIELSFKDTDIAYSSVREKVTGLFEGFNMVRREFYEDFRITVSYVFWRIIILIFLIFAGLLVLIVLWRLL